MIWRSILSMFMARRPLRPQWPWHRTKSPIWRIYVSEHDGNTLITVARELTDAGVKEAFRTIEAQDAGLEQFAIHGSLDE